MAKELSKSDDNQYLPCSFVQSGVGIDVPSDIYGVTTVKQDALYIVLTQKLTIEGPPRYLTPDWETAWQSVKLLRNLTPNIAITGHGKPISGHQLTEALNFLDEQFDTIAIPEYGQFITHDDS